ncbi:MAG: signal peptidase I [Patescibacteria group bacterium]
MPEKQSAQGRSASGGEEKKSESEDQIDASHVRPGFKRLARLQRKEEFLPSFSKSFLSFVIEVVKVVVISLAIIIPIRYFLIQPFYVRGASMEPNFHDNEYLIINEIGYRFSAPQRGDIVVIKSKLVAKEYLIKRVIGLPQEKIEINGGEVKIYNKDNPEGRVLKEEYLAKDITTSGNNIITLKSDEYYVMGDNRPSSLDSRSFGAIKRDEIVGQAWLRAWPFYKLKHFTTPEYNL